MKVLGAVVLLSLLICAPLAGSTATPASPTYRDAAAYGYRAAARILSSRDATGDYKNVSVRVSITAPLKPARDATLTVELENGATPVFPDGSDARHRALTFFKTPHDAEPIVRVTIGHEGGRNMYYDDAFVQLKGGSLMQLEELELSSEKNDGAHRFAGPLRLSNIVKLESSDEAMDRVGGSTTWHHALYRVTTPRGLTQILFSSIPIRDDGPDSGTPEPHPTPYVDAPLEGRDFCLWRDTPDGGPARPLYYAPC